MLDIYTRSCEMVPILRERTTFVPQRAEHCTKFAGSVGYIPSQRPEGCIFRN